MRKYLRPMGLALAFALLTAGVYAAASGDSLISLSYLQKTFFPQAVQAGQEAADKALQDVYDKGKTQLDAAAGGAAGGTGGLYSDTLQERAWSDGQILSLPTGSSFLMLDGSAAVSHSGVVVDVTAGTETASGAKLQANHRYLVGEDTTAALNIRSGEALVGIQGSYALTAGKEQHTPFYDVSQTDWFYAQVGYAYEHGLFSGMDAHHFSPQLTMNRAMLMSVLYRLAGSPAVAGGPSFGDVPAGQWYTQAVTWGASQGITSGVGPAAFLPNGQVTREQAVVMMYNYAVGYLGQAPGTEADLSGYGDQAEVSGWARTAMSWAVQQGIVSGVNNGGGSLTLEPRRSATRAEMAAMLQGFREKIL